MIKEAMCSFEVAKLLKQAGFDAPCLRYFDTQTDDKDQDYVLRIWSNEVRVPNSKLLDTEYACCTHQMAMRWMREVRKISIEPYAAAYRFGFTLSKIPTGSHICNEDDIYPTIELETWEDAEEAALTFCLNEIISGAEWIKDLDLSKFKKG